MTTNIQVGYSTLNHKLLFAACSPPSREDTSRQTTSSSYTLSSDLQEGHPCYMNMMPIPTGDEMPATVPPGETNSMKSDKQPTSEQPPENSPNPKPKIDADPKSGDKGGMQISQQDSNTMAERQECTGCKKKITDRYLLKALDQYWHEDCLKCSCCDCRLGEVGSTLFAKANLMLCRRDYLRLFGTTGYCSACSKMIPAFEMVMRAKGNVYHLECFACQQCNHRFCVGDRFYLCDNKILCEYDYEERMVFASMTYNYNALSQIKRQAQSLSDDMSSGYGSPSPNSL